MSFRFKNLFKLARNDELKKLGNFCHFCFNYSLILKWERVGEITESKMLDSDWIPTGLKIVKLWRLLLFKNSHLILSTKPFKNL